MFGSVTEWFYRWLAGIQPDPDFPGFERFTLSPFVPENLDFVNCNYVSPRGNIISNWKKEGKDKLIFELKIPEGCKATFQLLSNELTDVVIKDRATGTAKSPGDLNSKKSAIELNPGEYFITGTIN